MTNRSPFAGLQDLEQAFAEFESANGHPFNGTDLDVEWGKVRCSNRLSYAKRFGDFVTLLPEGKFPPRSQFLIFCGLHVYGAASTELWRTLREHYQRGKARGVRAATDEALDLWYAVDAWLQSWLYSPLSCRRPEINSPAEWLRRIGSTDPTPHLRMSYAFLRRLGFPLPDNYATARRELLDIKGVFQRYVIVPAGSSVPKLEALLDRFPLMGWDIWQRAVYLVTNDVKPPSHFPIFGWRHARVVDYKREGRLFHSPDIEHKALGKPWSLHGPLWSKQLETLRKMSAPSRCTPGPAISSGRMLRRISAHE